MKEEETEKEKEKEKGTGRHIHIVHISHTHPPKELIQTLRKYLLGKKCLLDFGIIFRFFSRIFGQKVPGTRFFPKRYFLRVCMSFFGGCVCEM